MNSSIEEELARTGRLVYTNRGVSMMPLLRENRDLMVIEKKGPGRCKRFDAILFKRHNGQYVMHRILEVRAKDYFVAGDNCRDGEYVTDEQILGVMTQVVRDGKTISVEDPAYQRYVHLWCDHYPLRMELLHLRDAGRAVLRRMRRE